MVPHMYLWSPTCTILLLVPNTLYGIGILWFPTYMEQVYGLPTCMYGPPHVKCLHVLYDSNGSPIPCME